MLNLLLSKVKAWGLGLAKAAVLALARHAATFVGGAVLTWLLSHHVASDFATRLVGDLQDMILTGTGVGLAAFGVSTSLKDVGNVHGKIAVTASAAYDAGRAQGQQEGVSAQAANDNAKVAAVSQAMQAADQASKQDRAAVVQALKTGAF